MKTSELTGAALDWAVAKCEGVGVDIDDHSTCPIVLNTVKDMHFYGGWVFKPSTDWAQGGPIIEREKLTIAYTSDALPNGVPIGWVAIHPERCVKFDDDGDVSEWHTPDAYGTTPLIAAMRCYVASKLGDEVEIPKELI